MRCAATSGSPTPTDPVAHFSSRRPTTRRGLLAAGTSRSRGQRPSGSRAQTGSTSGELARGAHPAWSPDSGSLATTTGPGSRRSARTGSGGRASSAAAMTDVHTHRPARLADGQIFVDGKPVTTIAADAYAPSVSPGGGRIAYVDDGRLFSAGIDGSAPRLLGRGYQPAWRPKPSVRELLPDFGSTRAERVDDHARRSRPMGAGFRSAVANMGTGVFHVAASRRPAEPSCTQRRKSRSPTVGRGRTPAQPVAIRQRRQPRGTSCRSRSTSCARSTAACSWTTTSRGSAWPTTTARANTRPRGFSGTAPPATFCNPPRGGLLGRLRRHLPAVLPRLKRSAARALALA